MRNNTVISISAGVVTAVSLGVLAVSSANWPPRFNPAPHQAAGRLLAQETLRRLGPGGQITVITRDTSDFKQPAPDLLLASFQRAVGRTHAAATTVHTLEVDPLRLIEVPSGDFMGLIGKASVGSVIVSLMGPPMLTVEQRAQLGTIRPKILAFCPGNQPAQIDLRQVFAQGMLDVAVVSRRHPVPTSSARDQEFFEIITITNVGTLYTSASARH